MTAHTISQCVGLKTKLTTVLLVVRPAMLSYSLTVGGGVHLAQPGRHEHPCCQ